MTTRILVVGGGAIGGVTAGKLTEAGHDVTVLDANPEHVARMRAPGLRLDEQGTRRTVPIAAVSDASELSGRYAFALVTPKAPYLEAALGPLVARGLVDTYVALGNGLVQERVASLVGADRLIVGTVEWGATNHGPGHVAKTTVNPFVIGEPDGVSRERTDVLADVLGAAETVRVTENIRGQVWSKLLVNSTFSGLGAVTGLLYGEVTAEPVGRRVSYALWTEGFTVASAAGIILDEVLGVRPEELVVRDPGDLSRAGRTLRVVMGRAAATKASMLQDLERDVPTEVDVINGGVVSQGARLGVRAPLNERVVEIVHGCEQGDRRPCVAHLAELDRLVPSP